MKPKEILHSLADAMFPRCCIVCGETLNRHERHLCLGCMADMPRTHFWDVPHNPMSDRFNEMIQERLTEGAEAAELHHEAYAHAAALFFYRSGSGYEKITQQVKYHGDTSCGIHFGKMLGRLLAGSGMFRGTDTIIPVPLHPLRQLKRGYNQAQTIASGIAQATGARMRTDILQRRRRTMSQTKLDIERKKENVKGAFAVRPEIRGGTEGIRKILLVDDVFTTGSTLCDCHRALRTLFPESVEINAVTLAVVE